MSKNPLKKLTLTALGLGAGAVGVCVAVNEFLFNRKLKPDDSLSRKIAGTNADHLQDFLENNLKWVEDYGYETHYIYSNRGEKLTGYLLKTKEPSKYYTFCAHGYRSYGKKEFCGVAQYYLEKGINVFFPDHVASGDSEGTHCTFGYYEKEDCIKWLNYLNTLYGEDINILLHGVSMGSATVCMMSAHKNLPENVKAIVADCGFSKAVDLFTYKTQDVTGIKAKHLMKLSNEICKKQLGFRYTEIEPVESVKNAKVPILFIHGEKDALVPCNMVYELYDACTSEKELLVIEDADHAQSYFKAPEKYCETMNNFLNKYYL